MSAPARFMRIICSCENGVIRIRCITRCIPPEPRSLEERNNMEAERLLHDNKGDFIAYCLKHRGEVDDSFLYDSDLADFEPDDENPTFVVREDGKVIAAASLILNDYHKRGKNGRFRIFHTEKDDASIYPLLLQEFLIYKQILDKIFMFIPLVKQELAEDLERLGFAVDRYSFILVKEITEMPRISFPSGYSIRPFEPGRDEADWCHIRNTAFANLKGSTTPVTTDMVHQMVSKPDYLEGGLMFLQHGDKPVGIIRGSHDEYEGVPAMNIGPVAILPGYQGKGLGKQLLRTALAFAVKMNYKKTVLCVNAENDRAKELYLREGFVQMEGAVAYAYFL